MPASRYERLASNCKSFFIYDKTSCPTEQVNDLMLRHTNLFLSIEKINRNLSLCYCNSKKNKKSTPLKKIVVGFDVFSKKSHDAFFIRQRLKKNCRVQNF